MQEKEREFTKKLMERYQKMFEGYKVPENVKKTACMVMFRFTVIGVCDGMYICNTIAHESGFGDGKGNFTEPASINACKSAEAIQDAYAQNISCYALDELVLILDTGRLDYSMARTGILRDIRELREQRRRAANWRRQYLDMEIEQKQKDLAMFIEMLGSNGNE